MPRITCTPTSIVLSCYWLRHFHALSHYTYINALADISLCTVYTHIGTDQVLLQTLPLVTPGTSLSVSGVGTSNSTFQIVHWRHRLPCVRRLPQATRLLSQFIQATFTSQSSKSRSITYPRNKASVDSIPLLILGGISTGLSASAGSIRWGTAGGTFLSKLVGHASRLVSVQGPGTV